MSDKYNGKYVEGTSIRNLIGVKFECLTIVDLDRNRLEIDRRRYKNGEIKSVPIYWICRCECGEYTSARYKRNYSCGCKKDAAIGKKNSKPRTMSFEQWCKDNNRQDFLDLWDYNLNNALPNEIGKGSSKKYYFKCKNGLHDSELWQIGELTRRSQDTLSCRKCNSFGYYLELNNLLDSWSKNNKNSAYQFTIQSNKKVKLICSDCGKEKEMAVHSFVKRGMCCSCSDSNSYPNKYIHNMLTQLNVEFKPEANFEWAVINDNKYDRVNGKKIYDCYIPNINCLIENHGKQHYDGSFETYGGRTSDEEQENDLLKRELALNNGIKHYIELDCRKSDMEWIKNSIMNSELPDLLGFKENEINWLVCHEFGLKNLARTTCELWESKRFNTTSELCDFLNIGKHAVLTYLKTGNNLGWCNYNAKDEMKKIAYKNGKNNCVAVEVFKDEKSLGLFPSAKYLAIHSVDLFGVNFSASIISMVYKGKRESYKGYIFKTLKDS